MDILRVAMDSNPEKTKAILYYINSNDALITRTLEDIVNEN